MKNSPLGWILIALTGGVSTFALTELFHWLFDPDPERIYTRMAADALSGAVVAGLAVVVALYAWERRQQTARQLQMISELNHHIRNALEVIVGSQYAPDSERARLVLQSVDRIDQTLDELFPSPSPPARRQ